MASWKSLAEPIKIGSLTTKNGVEAAPSLTCISHADQSVSRELVEFYLRSCAGALALAE